MRKKKLKLKKEFVKKYSKLTDFNKYEEYINKFPKQSIRINTLKISVREFKKRFDWKLKQIPWCKEGFWIKQGSEGERITIGNTYEHQLGYIYSQISCSMIPVEVLKPKKDDVVLDMCAAPGSKTTQMAAKMKNQGVIIANDKKWQRIKALVANLQRCGVYNTVVTIEDGRKIKGRYDKILVDVPCSATGKIKGFTRDSIKIVKSYSTHLIDVLSKLQKQLLVHGFDLLKENGTLVYSTCSLEPEEDEEVIKYLLKERDAKLVKISGFKSKVNSEEKELKKCIKIWPQFYDTEGFFVAKIKKA